VRGRAWETQLDYWHDQYRRDRRAFIVHTHPKVKKVGGRLIYEKKAPPDYIGVASGRGVCFDAKSTKAERWPFSSLAQHQARDLEANQENGGISFVALQMPAGRFVVPWEWLGPLYWEGDRRSLKADDLDVAMGADGWIGWLE